MLDGETSVVMVPVNVSMSGPRLSGAQWVELDELVRNETQLMFNYQSFCFHVKCFEILHDTEFITIYKKNYCTKKELITFKIKYELTLFS